MRRLARWITSVAAGLVLLGCTLAVMIAFPAPRGVYSAEGQLRFVTPNANGAGNAFRADAGNSVLFAAAVERIYNVTPESAKVVSPTTTLYGIGVRDGSRVTLPSAGGQWSASYDQPYLRVEVVSPDPLTSARRFQSVVADLRAIVNQRQREAGVRPAQMVHLDLSGGDLVYISGRPSRWLIAFGLLGAMAAAGGQAVVVRLRQRRVEPTGRGHQSRAAERLSGTSVLSR